MAVGFWTVDGSERGNSAVLLFLNCREYNVTLTHYNTLHFKKENKKRMINKLNGSIPKTLKLSSALK